MADTKEIERESTSKRKKRQRGTCVEKEDQVSRMQYEEDYAEGFLNQLFKELDETLFAEMLSLILKIETNVTNVEEPYSNMESRLKDRKDLQWGLLGFLRPYQALKCGKLLNYYEMCSMKQFVRNLMSHFKRQPHLLRKVIDKLGNLAKLEHLRRSTIEDEIAPLLQKNSALTQQLMKLLPSEKPPAWFYSSDDVWEDFSVDNDFDEEVLHIPYYNELANAVSGDCIYGCRKNEQISLCPICSVKFINGQIYIANGRIPRPANLVFNPSDEVENTIRLTGKTDFFGPSVSRARAPKRTDIQKESTDGNSSPLIVGTESEEELGENDIQPRKRRRRNTQRLKIRFNADTEEKKNDNDLGDSNPTDDTAPSNDDASCDDTSRDDNDNFCRDGSILTCSSIADSTSSLHKVQEVVNLEDVELNISTMHYL